MILALVASLNGTNWIIVKRFDAYPSEDEIRTSVELHKVETNNCYPLYNICTWAERKKEPDEPHER